MSTAPTIHHLENSRSQRVLWMLEELGLPYDVRRYERGADMRAPEILRKIHPLGRSPILTHEGMTIAETGTIVEYLLTLGEGHRLMPSGDSRHYWQARHFLHHAEGSAMPPLFLSLVLKTIPERAPFLVKPILSTAMDKVQEGFVAPELARLFEYWETSLGEEGWFAGPELSVADIMMSFPLEAADKRFGLRDRPKIAAFLERIHERAAYKRALERGGPYSFA